MGDRWQVVRLHKGAVTACCTHRSYSLAVWCRARRDGFRPWWDLTDRPRHDIRQEIRR